MKIRQGFVSNSSSSSFILLGRRISPTGIRVEDLGYQKYFAVGDQIDEGYDGFYIETEEMLRAVIESEYVAEFDVFECLKTGEDEIHFSPSDYGMDMQRGTFYTIKSFEWDQHSSQTPEDIRNNYTYKGFRY